MQSEIQQKQQKKKEKLIEKIQQQEITTQQRSNRSKESDGDSNDDQIEGKTQRIRKKGQGREEDSGYHHFMGSSKEDAKNNGKLDN